MFSAAFPAAVALKFSSLLSALGSVLSLPCHTAHTLFFCGCCVAAYADLLLRLLSVSALSIPMLPRAGLHMFFTYVLRRNVALLCDLGCLNISFPDNHSLFKKPSQDTDVYPFALSTNPYSHRAQHTFTTSVSRGGHLHPSSVLLGVCASAASLLSMLLSCDR